MAELKYAGGLVRINYEAPLCYPIFCTHLNFMMYKLGMMELEVTRDIRRLIWTRYDTEIFACVVRKTNDGYVRVADIMIAGDIVNFFPQKIATI